MEKQGSAAAAKQQAGMGLILLLISHQWRRLTANLLRSNELNKGVYTSENLIHNISVASFASGHVFLVVV